MDILRTRNLKVGLVLIVESFRKKTATEDLARWPRLGGPVVKWQDASSAKVNCRFDPGRGLHSSSCQTAWRRTRTGQHGKHGVHFIRIAARSNARSLASPPITSEIVLYVVRRTPLPAQAGTDHVDGATMHNLLHDPLIRVRLTDGTTTAMSLPDVYSAMSTDGVAAFPALRPHQRHAWHAFLAQLGTIALHRAGRDAPPESTVDWRGLLRNLTPEFGDDEPWRLIVEDPARPAFMQCPAPKGFDDYRCRAVTPTISTFSSRRRITTSSRRSQLEICLTTGSSR